MNYVIFDLEWNQPAVDAAMVTEPVYLTGEIIEIGAVKLDDSFQVVDELRLYIKPVHYTKLHRRIASLTGIRDKELQQMGLPFREACGRFFDWCGEEFSFMTWSLSDMPMLIDNMILHGVDITDLPVCYDIQRIFGREIMRANRRIALDTALEILGEKGDEAHDALHDARNTAKVCRHLELEDYLGEYGARVFAEQPLPAEYEDRAAARGDESLRGFDCPWCGQRAMSEGWLSMDHGTIMSMAVCPEGDEFLLTMELHRGPSGTYRPRRLMYEMSDDLYEIWQDQKEAQSTALRP